jgi:hypothetical protein
MHMLNCHDLATAGASALQGKQARLIGGRHASQGASNTADLDVLLLEVFAVSIERHPGGRIASLWDGEAHTV